MTAGTEQDEARAKGGRRYALQVDGRPFQSDAQVVSGAQIKALAGVDPGTGLFLEGRGKDPDRPIGDGESVDLAEPGRESFYSMPGATFGGSTGT